MSVSSLQLTETQRNRCCLQGRKVSRHAGNQTGCEEIARSEPVRKSVEMIEKELGM